MKNTTAEMRRGYGHILANIVRNTLKKKVNDVGDGIVRIESEKSSKVLNGVRITVKEKIGTIISGDGLVEVNTVKD